jgi:hypothetical protein
VDVIERRAAWLMVSLAILLVFNVASPAFAFQSIGRWVLIVHVGAMLCLAGAVVLLVASLAPDAVRPFTLQDRERFVFFAFVLLAAAVIAIVGLGTHGAIDAYRHPHS